MFRGFWRRLIFLVVLMASAQLAQYGMLGADAVEKALPVFSDIAKQAGVAFKVTCGGELTEYLIDVNGTGAAFFDYDNDGDQDIYLVNGSSRKTESGDGRPHVICYGTTVMELSATSPRRPHLGDTSWSSGCAVGDYNNDGHLDLYVTNFGSNKLYRE